MPALEGTFKCLFKAGNNEFDELSTANGSMPSPYLARAKRVTVTRQSVLNKTGCEKIIGQGYQLVKTKLAKKIRMQPGPT